MEPNWYIRKISSKLDPIYNLISELDPSDIGSEEFGDLVLYYEGFVDICWEDVEAKNKSIESLEFELISDFSSRSGLSKVIDSGWVHDPVIYEDNVFYVIFGRK